MTTVPSLACQGCNTTKPEKKVRWRSFDMDLPAVRMCVTCTHLIWTNPETFEAMGARRGK